jgi:hypothetical protein
MAITNATFKTKMGQAPGDPMPALVMTCDLDASYVTGGYANFKATVLAACKAEVGTDISILHVAQNNVPGTPAVVVKYDRTNDKLVCYDWAGAQVANATDLSGIDQIELVIFYK